MKGQWKLCLNPSDKIVCLGKETLTEFIMFNLKVKIKKFTFHSENLSISTVSTETTNVKSSLITFKGTVNVISNELSLKDWSIQNYALKSCF